jgi:hypothetical protein
MNAQTKNVFLLERIAERLGVPKPDGQVSFSPEPLALVKGLVDLLADPKAARKTIDEMVAATAKMSDATAAAEKAKADHAATLAAIADAETEHERKLAESKAAHDRALTERNRKADEREQALLVREREADELIASLKKERADLQRRLDLLKAASAG